MADGTRSRGALASSAVRAYLRRWSAAVRTNQKQPRGEALGLGVAEDKDGMNAIVDDLGEYRARVVLARMNNSSETIYNSSDAHAAVLIEQLFLAARQHVRVLCRRLNLSVWGRPEVIAAATQFLDLPGTRLQIIVAHAGELDFLHHPFLVNFAGRPNVELCAMDAEVDPGLDLFVADERAYRFEPDPREPIARASFNRPDFGLRLVNIFESTRGAATRLTAHREDVSAIA